MSKHNKANKSNYVQAGRLTPDEMGRQRKIQAEISAHAKGKERMTAKAPGPAEATPGRGASARGASRSRNEREE